MFLNFLVLLVDFERQQRVRQGGLEQEGQLLAQAWTWQLEGRIGVQLHPSSHCRTGSGDQG